MSKADQKLFRLIGRDNLSTLTNPELWKRYRRVAEAELRRPMLPEAFRSRMNRIRNRYHFPTSESIRKMRLAKPRGSAKGARSALQGEGSVPLRRGSHRRGHPSAH